MLIVLGRRFCKGLQLPVAARVDASSFECGKLTFACQVRGGTRLRRMGLTNRRNFSSSEEL